MIAKPEFAALSFKEMVRDVAGRALLELVQGTKWESIWHSAASEICAWRMSQEDITGKKVR